MAVPTDDKVDFAWKLLQQKGFTSTTKRIFEEIYSVTPQVPVQDVWLQSSGIPGTPVGSGIVEERADVKLTVDPSVPGNHIWIAASTFGNLSTRLDRWIPPRFGSGYGIKLYEDNGSGAKGTQIYTGDAIEWFFYYFGILYCAQDPFVANKNLPLHISGWRYVGLTGVPTVEVDKTHTHNQGVAASTWSVSHGFGRPPSFRVYSGGEQVYPKSYDPDTDLNTLTLKFDTAITGTAHLS